MSTRPSTSKTGHTDASIQVGTISSILLPRKHRDYRLNYEKETLEIIEQLSSLEQIPEDFFKKPFFYPFSTTQLNELKNRCWIEKDERDCSEGYALEQKLIKLYERVLIKQQEVIENVLPNLEQHFSDILSVRISTLEGAIKQIDDQMTKLIKRINKPGFFHDRQNAYIKSQILMYLRYGLQTLHDDYIEKRSAELNPDLDIENYLQTTEKKIIASCCNAKEIAFLWKKIQEHDSLFIKFLDTILQAFTFGFAHIPTKTESIIMDAKSSIANRF